LLQFHINITFFQFCGKIMQLKDNDLEELENDTTVPSISSYYVEEEVEEITVGTSPDGTLEDSKDGTNYKEGIQGLAGICAFRLMKKYPYLAKAEASILQQVPQWVEPYSATGRTMPSALLSRAAMKMDEVFLGMHTQFVDRQPKVIKRFFSAVELLDVGLPKEAILLFGKLRLLVRVRCLNRQRKSEQARNSTPSTSDINKDSRQAKTAKIWMA